MTQGPTTRSWTHRRLLLGYLGTLAVTLAAFAGIAVVLDALISREFAAYVGGIGSLVAWIGIPQGYARFCRAARVAPGSRPGAALRVVPVVAAIVPVWLLVVVAREYPSPSFVTLVLAASGIGLFWAVLSGCRAIARAGPAAARGPGPAGETP
jgi:hypothetical protein